MSEERPGVEQPDDDGPGGWQRLDRRMLLVHPIREVGRFLPVLLGLFVAGSAAGFGVLQALGVVVPIAVGVLRWVTTTYRVHEGRVELRRGLVGQRVLSVSLDRVRTVDLTAPAVHRLVGLTILRIGTGATGTDDDLDLDGLDAAGARELRLRLLASLEEPTHAADPGQTSGAAATAAAGAGGPTEAPGPDGTAVVGRARTVVSFDPAWLRFAPLTGSGLVVVAAVTAGLSQVLNLTGAWDDLDPDRWSLPLPLGLAVALGLLVAALAVVALSVAGYLVGNGNFRLARTPRSWQVSRGLVTTRETELDEERLAGVGLGQPLALRLAGGASLTAIVTGVDRSTRDSATLVPPAPTATVAYAAGEVLGDTAPVHAPLVGHGRAAVRRRWTRALVPATMLAALVVVAVVLGAPALLGVVAAVLLLGAAGLAHDRSRGLGHALVGPYLVARSGSLARRREVLDVDHVIGWTFRATLWQRRAGLTTLVATTAGGRQQVTVLDLPEAEAVALAHAALPDLVGPFLREPSAGAVSAGRTRSS